MFAVWRHFSRRDFPSWMGAGFGVVALGALARLDSRAAGKGPLIYPLNPYRPRQPHFAPRGQVERPHSVKDLHATILAALGLGNDELAYEVSGRQERLTGVAGSAKVIPGVLAWGGFDLV